MSKRKVFTVILSMFFLVGSFLYSGGIGHGQALFGHVLQKKSSKSSSDQESGYASNEKRTKKQLSQYSLSGTGILGQSAMEYLMTYGWAILIIAIVLGVLYYLGVFSPAVIGPACTGSAPYVCENPLTLSTSGTVTFTMGQASGSTQYNIGLSCAATSTSSGLPYSSVGNVFWYPASNGFISSTANQISPSLSLSSGEEQSMSGLPCYDSKGVPIGSIPIGTGFTGYIWYNYTTGSGTAVVGTNPWITSRIASISIKAT